MIRLREFQELSGLNDKHLLWMLKNNLLPCEYDREKGILVDLEKIDLRKTLQEQGLLYEKAPSEETRVLQERVQTLIRKEVTQVVLEAIKEAKTMMTMSSSVEAPEEGRSKKT